ncbi:hypothetical protein PGT21_035227 [Puccinia graminis f. sp. tritici]|uniref:Uncharacterized protein n=2 Tax=Puccinia graminis f. sp. tritici TaxID=56615 RepID=E3KHP1_PUCGT|nr:uncharacterized protein PGTG_09529 [Puccinia graminis f. sp. tritici CRL 75-36-700-3]EFP83816.1 hypothetical protein PGTG_09529 [Puccinia graminis f. sp. tritici CRL 75-36-700-3]KAA1087669.1 hypothetical protein PGT21_035227 [Puccinia graminis f. sp. tritici]
MHLTGPFILWTLVSLSMILAAPPENQLLLHETQDCTGKVYLAKGNQPCKNNCGPYLLFINCTCWECNKTHQEPAESCVRCSKPALDHTWHHQDCSKPHGATITVQEEMPPCTKCQRRFWAQREKMECRNCHAINNSMTSWRSLCNECSK